MAVTLLVSANATQVDFNNILSCSTVLSHITSTTISSIAFIVTIIRKDKSLNTIFIEEISTRQLLPYFSGVTNQIIILLN